MTQPSASQELPRVFHLTGAVPSWGSLVCGREMAQLGPAAAANGLSLTAPVRSVHASQHAHCHLFTPAADRDLPQLLSPSITCASIDHRIL
jgi:hypothetical protein